MWYNGKRIHASLGYLTPNEYAIQVNQHRNAASLFVQFFVASSDAVYSLMRDFFNTYFAIHCLNIV
ncbi:hypothetical protein ACFPQ1_28735 [Rhodocytophaga aerolata]|uniref:hypothetical protein n=1 Tax=Rhodocytophaga aerolata TaxID=455078 RepID=UPI003608A8F5